MSTPYQIDTILLERYRAVYVEIPKVACTSIKTALAPFAGVSLDTLGNPHEMNWPVAVPSRSGCLFPDRFSFAFVRNPWDRLLSCYRDKIGGEVDGYTSFSIRPGVADCLARFDSFFAGMSFEAFVAAVASIPDVDADAHFRSQHAFVTNEAGEIALNFIGHYEHLADDFQTVAQRIGLPSVNLPRLQTARTTVRYGEFYTPETQQIVAERFRKDVELFGYTFEAE